MLTPAYIQKKVREALQEDNYRRDITSKLCVSRNHRSEAKIVAREACVLCAASIAQTVFKSVDPSLKVILLKKDGQNIKAGTTILTIRGRTALILTAERTALNFLGYLSGITTLTRKYVEQIKPLRTKILDTRKTTPTLRYFERYAVRCGGGGNHRLDLSEMALIKDNHHAVYDNFQEINQAVRDFKQKEQRTLIEVEVTNLKQFRDVVKSGPDMVLLDNMTLSDMKKAVGINQKRRGPKILLEASGGITLTNIKAVARTGVDRISVGALTHSAVNVNFSMDIKPL